MNHCEIPDFFEPCQSRSAAADRRRVVHIPRRLTSKRRLFAIFVRELAFPAYFGWNWDAFEECLRDLSWLASEEQVFIRHQDLPFPQASQDRGVYLDILRAAHQASDRLHCCMEAADTA